MSTHDNDVPPAPPPVPPPERLLRLRSACPRCGSRPALRVTSTAVRAVAQHPPGVRLATFQCQRRRCGAVFDLTAGALQAAS